jgi:hypothetical protein
MPPGISIKRAIRTMAEATDKAGANRGPRAGRVGLGATLADAVQFNLRGEMR